MRSPAGALVLAAALALGRAAGAAPPADDLTARAGRSLAQDADAIRRLAAWGDEHGVPREADADWELALRLDPDHEATRRRLRYLRREGAWVRDDASWALLVAGPDPHPERASEYRERRAAEFERPAAARWREVAAACRAAGRVPDAEHALRTALERKPDDLWSRLALGETADPVDGWVPWDLRARRAAEERAAAEVRRLRALRGEPLRRVEPSARSPFVGTPLSVWTLREWRIETDMDDEAATLALVTADLGTRWFRGLVGLAPGAAVLPDGGVLVLLSTIEGYRRAVDAEPGLTPAERAFGRELSAMPVPPVRGRPWVVIVLRPDATTAADACLHYAIHLAGKAWARVEASDAWLYEGLAAYAGIRLFGTQASWCVRLEATRAQAIEPDRPDPTQWAEAAARIALAHDDVPARALLGAGLNAMDGPMLIKSWSLLRWMIEEHPEEARSFLEEKRSGVATVEALYRATGLAPEDLDAAWRLEVLATEGE